MINKLLFKLYVKVQSYLLKNTSYLDYDFTLIDKDFIDFNCGDFDGKL